MDKNTLKLREEQNRDTAQHRDTCEDTNRRVYCMPTRREFYIAIAVFLLLTMSGKLVRGSFWFEGSNYTPYVKMRQNAETMKVLFGILEDNPDRLDAAKTVNEYRTQTDYYGERHKFEFVRWTIPEKCVEFMLSNNSTNCLNWLQRQDGWQSVLSDNLVDSVTNYKDKDAIIARYRHKLWFFKAWWHDDPTQIDGSRKGRIKLGIEQISNSWLNEFLEGCHKYDKTNMVNYLDMDGVLNLNDSRNLTKGAGE